LIWMIVLISLYFCEILNFIMSNFFLSYILNMLSFLFFPWYTNAYLDTPHSHTCTRKHARIPWNIFVAFFSLFFKTISPVHYCRYSSITRMPWYCKFVKNIYMYIYVYICVYIYIYIYIYIYTYCYTFRSI